MIVAEGVKPSGRAIDGQSTEAGAYGEVGSSEGNSFVERVLFLVKWTKREKKGRAKLNEQKQSLEPPRPLLHK